jgi:uncharacterized membrane protein SpoIIM required for sporulation
VFHSFGSFAIVVVSLFFCFFVFSCVCIKLSFLLNDKCAMHLLKKHSGDKFDSCLLWRSLTRTMKETTQIMNTKGIWLNHKQCNSQKSIPFTCVSRPPFIGRRADFLHSKNDLL